MSREEELARKLIKLYKCKVKVCHGNDLFKSDLFKSYNSVVFNTGNILVKPTSSSIIWSDTLLPYSQVFQYRNWNEVLFGSFRQSSLTDAIKERAAYSFNTASRNRKKLLLDFKTCDELDILLTLAGCNSVSA